MVEPEVLCLESANFHHFGRFICGIIGKAEAFQKSRAQKMSGGAAGGGAAQNANSDEAKPRSEAAKRSREAASEELTQCVNNF